MDNLFYDLKHPDRKMSKLDQTVITLSGEVNSLRKYI